MSGAQALIESRPRSPAFGVADLTGWSSVTEPRLTFGKAKPYCTAPAARRWSPDLARHPLDARWWRDLAALVGLLAATWLLRPDLGPLPGPASAPLTGTPLNEARAQTIGPLALGSATGREKADTGLVVPIAAAPERASVNVSLTLGEGDSLDAALVRNGAAPAEARAAAALAAAAAPVDGLRPGTAVTVTLGSRSSGAVARSIDKLDLRARFDLTLSIVRRAGRLQAETRSIAVDATPLRIAGVAGPSLYRATRAAGATAGEAEQFIKALASRFSFNGDVAAGAGFAMVVERQRAETGEVRLGRVLSARLDGPSGRTELVRWAVGGREEWFDADGRFEQRGAVGMPVAGHITSGFGMRFHPLLGFSRMHKGIDIGAAQGTPVIAVVAGTVQSAGWSGGYGNFIRLQHAPGFATGYGHLSRIAVAPGQQVARGEVIGFVGSTGMSTGPHLHWEVWRNGVAVDPMTVSVDSISTLDARQMAAFRAEVARLRAVGD